MASRLDTGFQTKYRIAIDWNLNFQPVKTRKMLERSSFTSQIHNEQCYCHVVHPALLPRICTGLKTPPGVFESLLSLRLSDVVPLQEEKSMLLACFDKAGNGGLSFLLTTLQKHQRRRSTARINGNDQLHLHLIIIVACFIQDAIAGLVV